VALRDEIAHRSVKTSALTTRPPFVGLQGERLGLGMGLSARFPATSLSLLLDSGHAAALDNSGRST